MLCKTGLEMKPSHVRRDKDCLPSQGTQAFHHDDWTGSKLWRGILLDI